MVQFSVQIQDHDEEFIHVLHDLKQQLSSFPTDRLLFHIYSTVFSPEKLAALIARLNEQFCGCQIVCCTVTGSVLEHDYQPGVVLSVEVFERQDSRAEVRLYELKDGDDKAAATEIMQFVQDHSWVKAVEIYRTVHDMDTSELCGTLSGLPEGVIVFGGIACAEDVTERLSYIADQSGKVTNKGIVTVYYGGSDLHIKACKMSGWKPIEKSFTVTRAENNIIKEIDGAPAWDIYKRYLDIDPDDNFSINVLEFPLLSQDQGHSVVRNVFTYEPDGGLMVAYNVNPGAKLKICYADADSIIAGIHAISRDLARFTPDVVSVVSCITRSMIWRMKDYMPELQGFKSVAPCHGYLSYGELIREKGVLNHHNTILIAAAFREGEVKDVAYPEELVSAGATIPLPARLSTFISRVTDELQEMYSEVEQAATIDALTQIGNRFLFDDVVKSVSIDTARANTKYLIMFDLNELKFVNDTFGHNEGDVFIKAAAKIIANSFSQYGQCFRIGGDEFAVIADFESEAALQKALNAFYENLREHNKTALYALSSAVGYAALSRADGKLRSTSEWKMTADINMYRDKAKFHAIKPNLLSQNMIEFISCIMSLLDNKNPTLAFHSARVQRMASAIAQLMQLEDLMIERVKLAAYLHDIGKIGLSDAVLATADPVSDNDHLMRQRLPGIGRRLLMTSEETKEIANVVYACFERWDGSGYPEALAGNDIPLEARIIAAADFIDSALHDRNDRAALSKEECIRRLAEYSGSRFDPAVISVVLSNFEDIIDPLRTDP